MFSLVTPMLVRAPLPLLRGKNGKALINLGKAENDGIDALKVRSIKNSKSLLECPTVTALVATDTKPSLIRNCRNRTWLELTGLSNFAGKPTENVMLYFDKTHGLRFL